MSKVVKTNIEEAIARIDDWKGKEISYEPVAGGITNPNFKVTVDGTAHFLSGSFPVSLASQEEGRKPVIGEPLASSGSYYGYRSYMLSANPMFAIDMTALPRNMEISSFTLGSRYNYYNYQVSLYNQVSGDWEVWNRYVVNRTTGQGDWEENGVPNLDKYARDGYLYVRFEKSGSTEDYADVSEPQLTVEGRVK